MKFKRLIIILLQLLPFENTLLSSDNIDKYPNLVLLSNNNAEVGILKNAGGRIVIYKRIDGENVLKSDESLWNYKFEKSLDQCVDMEIIPFNGHITWLGPQSEWWTKQNVHKDLRDNKSNWPPDPYLIYADCEVIRQTGKSITLLNPPSPFTGVQLTKKITLEENGDLEIISEIKNIRDTSITWDIWFNTRLNGINTFFVPVNKKEDIKIKHSLNSKKIIKEKIIDNYFTFEFNKEVEFTDKVFAKAFIYPSMNKIFAFNKNELLTIKFDLYPMNLVHPEQAVIEVFNTHNQNGDSLLELEYHSPYTKLEPNQTLTSKEYWSLEYFNNNDEISSKINLINSL